MNIKIKKFIEDNIEIIDKGNWSKLFKNFFSLKLEYSLDLIDELIDIFISLNIADISDLITIATAFNVEALCDNYSSNPANFQSDSDANEWSRLSYLLQDINFPFTEYSSAQQVANYLIKHQEDFNNLNITELDGSYAYLPGYFDRDIDYNLGWFDEEAYDDAYA